MNCVQESDLAYQLVPLTIMEVYGTCVCVCPSAHRSTLLCHCSIQVKELEQVFAFLLLILQDNKFLADTKQ